MEKRFSQGRISKRPTARDVGRFMDQDHTTGEVLRLVRAGIGVSVEDISDERVLPKDREIRVYHDRFVPDRIKLESGNGREHIVYDSNGTTKNMHDATIADIAERKDYEEERALRMSVTENITDSMQAYVNEVVISQVRPHALDLLADRLIEARESNG